jgi:hypothetical protein
LSIINIKLIFDKNNLTAFVHSNFKLSASGEELMLSNSTGVVFDSVTFGAQNGDVASARCANGTGNFTPLYPTFNSWNCISGISENETESRDLLIYPNPAKDNITIEYPSDEKENYIRIYNSLGEILIDMISSKNQENIDLSQLKSGVYLINVNKKFFKQLVIVK